MSDAHDDSSALFVQAFAAQLGFAPLAPILPTNDPMLVYGRALAIVRKTPEYQDIIARRRRGELTPRQAFDEIHVLADAVTTSAGGTPSSPSDATPDPGDAPGDT